MKIIKPKQLVNGDVIGLIAPASNVENRLVLEKGVRYFEKLGYRIELGKNIENYFGYLAGKDQERVDDLHTMFENKNVKAIICIRGGYGAFRLLDKIDYRLIRKNPKIFVGFSEITSLQMAIFQKVGLVTFAGPMLYPDFSAEINSFTEEFFWRCLTSSKKIGKVSLPEGTGLKTIVRGKSSGQILGGNLAVLSALIGTDYFPDLSKKILFIEDVGEMPYKIDRMFNKMRLSKIFRKVNGVVLGNFVDCVEKEKRTLTIEEVFDDYLKKLGLPVVINFPHGHTKEKVTIPLGIEVKLNASKGIIEFTESGVR